MFISSRKYAMPNFIASFLISRRIIDCRVLFRRHFELIMPCANWYRVGRVNKHGGRFLEDLCIENWWSFGFTWTKGNRFNGSYINAGKKGPFPEVDFRTLMQVGRPWDGSLLTPCSMKILRVLIFADFADWPRSAKISSRRKKYLQNKTPQKITPFRQIENFACNRLVPLGVINWTQTRTRTRFSIVKGNQSLDTYGSLFRKQNNV